MSSALTPVVCRCFSWMKLKKHCSCIHYKRVNKKQISAFLQLLFFWIHQFLAFSNVHKRTNVKLFFKVKSKRRTNNKLFILWKSISRWGFLQHESEHIFSSFSLHKFAFFTIKQKKRMFFLRPFRWSGNGGIKALVYMGHVALKAK